MTALGAAGRALGLESAGAAPFGPVVRLSWRLVRRSALIAWLAVAAYLAVEVLAFRRAYPDEAARRGLLQLSESSVVRITQGPPGSLDTGGGFAVWDGGWMLALVLACWAALSATRMTRGEEDSGRADLVLSRPVSATRLLCAYLAGLGAAVTGVGAAAAGTLMIFGELPVGSLIWGAGLAALGAVACGVGAVSAQLAASRRLASASALSAVAAAFLLRLVANSTDARSWMLRITPLGWLDQLHAFAGNDWIWLLAPAAATGVLVAVSVVLASRRDVGAAAAPRARSEARRSRLRLLGGAVRFGWRSTFGVLAAWTIAMSFAGAVLGLMTKAIVDFIAGDATYRGLLESMGLDMTAPAAGYISYLAQFMALPFAAFAAWRIGAARREEAEGRLDNVLVRGATRSRWLAGTALAALLACAIVVSCAAAGLWAGATIGGANVRAAQVAEPMVGTMPLISLFGGVAVLAFGVAPRLTVVAPTALAAVGYTLNTFGEMLEFPGGLLALSPFHHLARLPASPMSFGAATVLAGIGLVAAAAGIAGFSRRDIRGA